MLKRLERFFFKAVVRLDGAVAIAFLMLALSWVVHNDPENIFLVWMEETTFFTTELWHWAFLIFATLIIFLRPGTSVLGSILIAPALLFFYLIFRYLVGLWTEGILVNYLLFVIVGWAFLLTLFFYIRSRVIEVMYQTIVTLKLENQRLRKAAGKTEGGQDASDTPFYPV